MLSEVSLQATFQEVGWEGKVQGETILRSEVRPFGPSPSFRHGLYANWREKNQSLLTSCVVRCVSVLLIVLRPLLAPQAAHLSPTWSRSVLTTHSPVSLAQGFASSPNVQVSLHWGPAQVTNSQRANTAGKTNEMVSLGWVRWSGWCTASHRLSRTSQPGGKVLATLDHSSSSSGT